MKFKHVLCDQGEGQGGSGGGGGGGASGTGASGTTQGDLGWRAALPEQMRGDPSLLKFNNIEDLAKSYVSAQQLIGTKRLEAPQQNWDETKWGQFYDSIGRPKDHKAYVLPDGVKPREGISLDEAKLDKARETFHKLGLTEKQGKEVLGYYIQSVNGVAEEQDRALTTGRETAMAELKGKYGDKLNEKIAAGRLAVEKVGGDQFKDWLSKTKAGDDPVFIDVMVKIGEMMSADSSRGAGGSGGSFGSEQQTAVSEISTLKTNKEFMDALMTQHHPGHAAALERWTKLFTKAYPGKQAE